MKNLFSIYIAISILFALFVAGCSDSQVYGTMLGNCVIQPDEVCVNLTSHEMPKDDEAEIRSTVADAEVVCSLLGGTFTPAVKCDGYDDAQHACWTDTAFYGRHDTHDGFRILQYLPDYHSDDDFQTEEQNCTLGNGSWDPDFTLHLDFTVHPDIPEL